MRSSFIGSYFQLEDEQVKAFWKILAYPAQLPFLMFVHLAFKQATNFTKSAQL